MRPDALRQIGMAAPRRPVGRPQGKGLGPIGWEIGLDVSVRAEAPPAPPDGAGLDPRGAVRIAPWVVAPGLAVDQVDEGDEVWVPHNGWWRQGVVVEAPRRMPAGARTEGDRLAVTAAVVYPPDRRPDRWERHRFPVSMLRLRVIPDSRLGPVPLAEVDLAGAALSGPPEVGTAVWLRRRVDKQAEWRWYQGVVAGAGQAPAVDWMDEFGGLHRAGQVGLHSLRLREATP